jgi:3-oxoadipate enol-lactonase
MPYLEVSNTRLFYEWYGNPQGPTVMFVNGLLADTTGWSFQVPAFAPHFHVLLYDCCGQGQSGRPNGPYTPAQHIQDAQELLDGLAVQRAHVVGLSNGGAIAMGVAASKPELVDRLVVADTFPATDMVMQAKLESWLLVLDKEGLAERFDVSTPWVWSQAFLARHGHLLDSLREQAARADKDAVRNLIAGALEYDLRSQIPTIQAPTLVLVGEEDVLTPPWYARTIASMIPQSTLCIVPHAGHALPIEQPAIFNALILAFLQQEE